MENRPSSTFHPALTLSVIVPVHRGGEYFRRCLTSLIQANPPPDEIIVVADGDGDGSWRLAKEFGIEVLRLPTTRGPAHARNTGARQARGSLLFFVDADVTIPSDALAQVLLAFTHRPDLAALFGSYDDEPGASNFLSQYKNLFHHFIHQTAREDASTFWAGCGVVRRDVFLGLGGFDENYPRPCIEDIELGYRLKKAGYSIRLSKTLQAKHLKRWGVISLFKSDFFDRALPWTELILRDRRFISDLNLRFTSRLSVITVYSLLMALGAACFWPGSLAIVAGLALLLLMLNLPVYLFFYRHRGLWFALKAIPWHWLYYLYSGLAFAIGLIRYASLKPDLQERNNATPSEEYSNHRGQPEDLR